MDFEPEKNMSEPPFGQSHPEQAPGSSPEPPPPPHFQAPPGPPVGYWPVAAAEPKKRKGWKVFWSIILILSIFGNIVLFLGMLGFAALVVVGHEGVMNEAVIQAGPSTTKIAVVRLEGMIDERKVREVYRQLKIAREDSRVKGIILRVNSPGGTISGSDDIYNELKNKTDKPVVAFMQGVAASGGYYASVACDRIMAEQTVITGSIGVIAGWFVVKDLLETKLGIEPVFVKSGPRKDWPSSFDSPTPEVKQYLQEKLIGPAYERFLEVVADGRKEKLTVSEVRELADGSIYGAKEALEKKLIDSIGYLDDVIAEVMQLAGISEAMVVEYRRPFSLVDSLMSRGEESYKLDRSTLYKLGTPEVLYLWRGQ